MFGQPVSSLVQARAGRLFGVKPSLNQWWFTVINTLRPRQNGRRFADDTFRRIFLNENVGISIEISLKFVAKGPINNNPALVQIMAWRRSGDKPLSEPMVVSLLTHICVTRPQWVNNKIQWNFNQTKYIVPIQIFSHKISLLQTCTEPSPDILQCIDGLA